MKYRLKYAKSQWDTQKETISYLEKDLSCLLEVINKFNVIIYERFGINFTRVRTISGLAFLIYTSNYYDTKKTPISLSKGKIDNFIRKGFYGGIVDVNINYADFIHYKYDVNSHYPNAMLMPMPGGNPRISSERNLDKIFGFVEAIIEAPSEKELKVAILPCKVNGNTELFRGTCKGVWWSEELKMARDYGYKIIEITNVVEFDRVVGTFDNYIKDIYNSKKQADLDKNDVLRYIFKLLLNSLFGRLGLKTNNIKLSIVPDNKLDKKLLTENSEILYKANNLNLIKSFGPLDFELIKIIQDEKLYENKINDFNFPNPWGSNTSSVQYSAAITAYARMKLNIFKNMENNIYLGGDTDSIIMSQPLDPKYLGVDIGLFKLEYIIKEGFYHSKKFYLVVDIDNNIIIKAKGINNENNVLNYNSFVELFKGNTLTIDQIQFNKDYKNLSIKVQNTTKHIPGLKDPIINYKLNNRSLVVYNPTKYSIVKFYKY